MAKSWWGQHFIQALETFTDSNRLARGKAYASSNRIEKYNLNNGKILASIKGNVSPGYFGTYETPVYKIKIEMPNLTPQQWQCVLAKISQNARFLTQLLLKELPENIEEIFKSCGHSLLPYSKKDFKTSCSCPDDANPCKHIAALCYYFAEQLEQEPLLLFEIRGLSQEKLAQELEKTPLGRLFIKNLQQTEITVQTDNSYYPLLEEKKVLTEEEISNFWQAKKIPEDLLLAHKPSVSAIVIKKAGDYPSFWNKQKSFIEVMEEIYQRTREYIKK